MRKEPGWLTTRKRCGLLGMSALPRSARTNQHTAQVEPPVTSHHREVKTR